jgi:hypothetical protein
MDRTSSLLILRAQLTIKALEYVFLAPYIPLNEPKREHILRAMITRSTNFCT